MAKAKKSIQEVVQKEFPDFVEAVAGLAVVDLESRLSTYVKEEEKVDEAKDNDQALADAKSEASELAAPYSDAKKAIRKKVKYLIHLIKEKGGQ